MLTVSFRCDRCGVCTDANIDWYQEYALICGSCRHVLIRAKVMPLSNPAKVTMTSDDRTMLRAFGIEPWK